MAAQRSYNGRMSTTSTSLIRRICDPQHREAWTEFVATYQAMVRGYVAAKSSRSGARLHDHDVDDVVQSVWIKLWKHSADFHFDGQRGRFRTFLYAITMNALIDFIRRRKKHQAIAMDLARIDVLDERIRPDDEWDVAYRAAIWQRIAGPLKAELLQNSPAKWLSFEEHKLRGRPAKEVAEELKIDVTSVYQNTTRVMQEVRRRCQATCEEELVS